MSQEELAGACSAIELSGKSGTATETAQGDRPPERAAIERLLTAVHAIATARSLSAILSALVSAASAEARRAALFVVRDGRLQCWKTSGLPRMTTPIDVGADSNIALAMSRGQAVSTSDAPAPAFTALPSDRSGLAVPLLIADRTVAVLYVDAHSEDDPAVPPCWPEAVQILAQHASVCLAHVTALRTGQAKYVAPAPGGASPRRDAPAPDDEQSARRYARLLVSEIKLYNEAAVSAGREKRDLLQRLRPEIDRARRLYEERVPPAQAAQNLYFHQELVQTLAGGDPALLGGSAHS